MVAGLTVPQFAAANAAVVFAAALQGSIGFGFGLAGAPLLLLVDPRLVPGPILGVSFFLALLSTIREHQAMHVHGMAWALVGRVPGTLLGAAAIAVLQARLVTLALGILILSGVVMSVLRLRFPERRGTLVAFGALSGFMGTVSSIGGPPIALLYQHAPGPRIRATLGGFFMVGVAMSIAALAAVGRFGPAELRVAGSLLPAMVLGFLISGTLAPVVDQGRSRIAVLAVSAIAAIAVILKELL